MCLVVEFVLLLSFEEGGDDFCFFMDDGFFEKKFACAKGSART